MNRRFPCRFLSRSATLLATALLLSACGGGGGDDDNEVPEPPTTTAPGGLYVGYYQENPTTNPEDPVPGAFTLNLPAANGSFSGSMFFTYIGCQSSNVGVVAGVKTDLALSGTWGGTVDGLAQAGTYAGTYDAASLRYGGTYVNGGGKQRRNLLPCIDYTIAPDGSFEMFAVEARVPDSFVVTVTDRRVSWPAVASGSLSLLYVLDPAVATAGTGNPVVWQAVVPTVTSLGVPVSVVLEPGRQYVAVVAVLDAGFRRVAFASRRFTAPPPT